MADDSIVQALDDVRDAVEERVRSGRYGSAGDVLRAALDALESEESALESELRERVRASLADPSPTVPLDEAVAEFAAWRADLMKRDGGGI